MSIMYLLQWPAREMICTSICCNTVVDAAAALSNDDRAVEEDGGAMPSW